MASKNLIVDFAEMENYCQKLKALNNDFDANIKYLKNNATFLNSEWSGDAATNYNSSINSYISDLEKVEDVFLNVQKYLSQKTSDYNSLDRLD